MILKSQGKLAAIFGAKNILKIMLNNSYDYRPAANLGAKK